MSSDPTVCSSALPPSAVDLEYQFIRRSPECAVSYHIAPSPRTVALLRSRRPVVIDGGRGPSREGGPSFPRLVDRLDRLGGPRRLTAGDSIAVGMLVTEAVGCLVASLGDDERVDAVRAALVRVHHRLDAGDPAPVIGRALADAGAAVDRLERASPAASVATLRDVLARAAALAR
ncbi:MAG: hypothetical protein JO180_11850 [Gemmatirosa sp.]|nr:hypothetical protein [Gemmatirosa sp.]